MPVQIRIFICLGFNFLGLFLFAQNNVVLQHLSVKEGLSQNTVKAVAQDYKGFIWIATYNGLNRYDGSKFTKYFSSETDSTSIVSNEVYEIFEDKNKKLWFGAANGLVHYNYEHDNFKTYNNAPGIPYSLNPVNVIENHSETNKLFLGGPSGIFLFDTYHEKFKHFFLDSLNFNSNSVITLLNDSEGHLWVFTETGGAYVYNIESDNIVINKKRTKVLTQLKNKRIWSILRNSEGTIYLGSEDGVLYEYSETGGLKQYNVANAFIDGIVSMVEDDNGILWVATDKSGIFLFNPTAKSFKRFDYKIEPGGKIITSLFKDMQGIIWISTYFGGIYLYDETSNNFKFNKPYANIDGINTSNSVMDICEDRERNLWAATDGGGLVKYTKNLELLKIYTTNNTKEFKVNTILSVLNTHNNNLFVGTYLGGLLKYNFAQKKFALIPIVDSNGNEIENLTVWDIYQDFNENIWLCTNNNGLFKYNLKTESIIQFSYEYNNEYSLSSHSVRCLLQDSQKDIWVGTVHGLNKFNASDSTFVRYFHDPNKKESLSKNSILCLHQGSDNNIWIGTFGGGVSTYNKKTKTFSSLNTSNGLISNIVYGILEDEQGNLWFSTDKGISKYNRALGIFNNFDSNYGLLISQFNLNSAYQNKNGQMFFGSTNGLCSFNPTHIKQNLYVPPVYITNISINDKELKPGIKSPLKKAIVFSDSLQLEHFQNKISFGFATLNFNHSYNNKFQYKLSPVDKNWNLTQNSTSSIYSNLKPGKYVFMVKGSNNDNVWNNTPKTLSIFVNPPYWETLWFRAILIACVLLFVYTLYRLKIYSVRQQKQKLEHLLKLKAEEIKLQNKTIIKSEKENAALIQEKLNKDLKDRNKELYRTTLLILQKNSLLEDLKKKLKEAIRKSDNLNKSVLKSILRTLSSRFSPLKEWREFDLYFNEVHSNFAENLKSEYPDLTHYDLRLCALYLINLPTVEISEILAISVESVKKSRYRLRKKLMLNPEDDLLEFLKKINKNSLKNY